MKSYFDDEDREKDRTISRLIKDYIKSYEFSDIDNTQLKLIQAHSDIENCLQVNHFVSIN